MATPERQMPAPPEGVKFVDPRAPEQEPEYTEEQAILYDENGTSGAVDPRAVARAASARVQGTQIPVNTRMLRLLPVMRKISEDPNMPPSIRDMYRTTVLSIESKLKNG